MMTELPAIFVSEPHELLHQISLRAWRSLGVDPIATATEVDSSAFIHDEAELLDADELATAEGALLEDGIFEEGSWPDEYLASDAFAGANRERLLRAAIKYGWALAHLAPAMAASPAEPVIWSLGGGATATTALEMTFLGAELRRRGLHVRALAPCWPVTLQRATDLTEGRDAIFSRAVEELALAARSAPCDLLVRNAMDKLSVLPQIGRSLGARAVLEFAGMGALEGARLIARVDPALFWRLLACAQERFTFDKGREELFTSEDDVHALPEVPDAELERVFLEDTRGRQLLHVTARSTLAEPELGMAAAAIWRASRAELECLIATRAQQHLAACRPCPAI